MVIETLAALWLFPAGVIALLLLQLWQARRRELLVGSLLVWRRVAEKERAKPRRRLVLDRSFWLQTATLLALSLAWANPVWTGRSSPGRSFVVVLDNGPSARLRTADGTPVWDAVQTAAHDFLRGLAPSDRVILCAAVPLSRHIPENKGVPAERALEELSGVTPGLTPCSPKELWRLALGEARLWADLGRTGEVRSLVFSAQADPADRSEYGQAHWITVLPAKPLSNVGLTALNATSPFDPQTRQLLVQVRNFGATPVRGTVSCEVDGGQNMAPQQVEISAGGAGGVVFSFPDSYRPCRLSWSTETGPDALPEDDTLTVVPRTIGTLRVRWHGKAPHLQALYRLALGVEELPLDAKDVPDLEVFVESLPPESLPVERAFLLLAPPASFGPFEVLGETIKRPTVRLGDPDALTRGLTESRAGLDWPIAEARAIRQVGDLRLLAQDGKGHVLAARLASRPGYLFAFVPGEGLGWAPERRFDSPGLAAVLLRILREAAGAEEPFSRRTTEAIEKATGQPLPLDWQPAFDREAGTGQGVLDARVSGVALATKATASAQISAIAGGTVPERYPLWPLLVLLAIVLVLVEVRAGRTMVATSVPTAKRTVVEGVM